MLQPELLKKVLSVLDETGIDYMITGSIASSLQGEPRASHDIDIVINIQPVCVPKLISAFPFPKYYLSENSIKEAIQNNGMFNLLDTTEGDKVDFWLLTNEPFDQSRFNRKYEEKALGLKMKVSTIEDTILAKLRWAKLSGGSEKQFTDALRIYEVQYGKLDLQYIERWAKQLEVLSLWNQLIEEANPLI